MVAAERDMEEAAELELDQPADDDNDDELLLGGIDMIAEEEPEAAPEEIAPAKTAGRRTWLSREGDSDAAQSAAPAAAPPSSGGTLFERMSNIARGAAKAQVEDETQESEAPRMRTGRDPLDIPRFLNRQNNQ
jgi:cell division protein FtsZ